jgi:rhodanese-related sulfurtransferase
MSRERFIEMVTAELPDAPPYFTYDAVLNARERPTLEQALARELNPLSLERVVSLQRDGAQLLDTRDPAQFAAAHLRGSLNIGLSGSYATWCGTILDRQRPIVLIAEPGRELEAATRLGRIGFDTIAGYLAGGMERLARAPQLVERTQRITAGSLAAQLNSSRPPLLVDVRTPPEWKRQRIDGAINLPLNRLRDQMNAVPAGGELAVYCTGGYRSAIATSLMLRASYPTVTDLVGGLAAWDAAGLPLTTGAPPDTRRAGA